MANITPLKFNFSTGNISQFIPGDKIDPKFSGVGQKFRGSVQQQSGTTIIPFDNSAPVVTEGSQLWSQSVTCDNSDSVFKIEFDTEIDINAVNKNVTIAFFRDSVFLGCRTSSASGYNGVSPAPISMTFYDQPGVGTFNYTCRIGIDSSGTWYLGKGNSQSMGGNNPSWWSISEEI